MNDAPLPEALEQFLQTPPSVPGDPALQQAILQRTLPLVPRRRGWRKWAVASAWAASVAVAFAAGWALPRSGNVEAQPRPQIVEHKPPAPPEVKPQPPVTDVAPKSAYELEWAAFDTMEDRERSKLYFRAGDLYLENHNDIPSTLRCYRQAIACCDADGLAFDPKDNSLVMLLKHDFRKEK